MSQVKRRDKGVLVDELLDKYYLNLSSDKINALDSILKNSDELDRVDKLTLGCLKKIELFEGYLRNLQESLSIVDKSKSKLSEDAFKLNTSINNRKIVKDQVRNYINNLMIDETLVNTIADSPAGESEFMVQLYELDKKISVITNYVNSTTSFSAKNVVLVVDALKDKAIEKIKDNLTQKINLCQNNSSNYSMIQNSMVALNFFYEFLERHANNQAIIIKEHYLQTIQTMYFKSIQVYMKNIVNLLKIKNKSDNDRHSVTSTTTSNKLMNKTLFNREKTQITFTTLSPNNFFSIKKREKILNIDFYNNSIIPHMFNETEDKISNEIIFHSLINVLYTNSITEHQFLEDFFKTDPLQTINDYEFIFSRCFQLVINKFDNLFNDKYDIIGLLICSALISRFIILADSHNLSSLVKYFEIIFKVVWDRVEDIINVNIESLAINMGFNDEIPDSISYNDDDESISSFDCSSNKAAPFLGSNNSASITYKNMKDNINDSKLKKSLKNILNDSFNSDTFSLKNFLQFPKKLLKKKSGSVVNYNTETSIASKNEDIITKTSTSTNHVTLKISDLLDALISLKGGINIDKIENIIKLLIKKWFEYINFLTQEKFHIIMDKLVFTINNISYILNAINNANFIQFPTGFHLTKEGMDLSDYQLNFTTYKESLQLDIDTELDQTKYQLVQNLIENNFGGILRLSRCIDLYVNKPKSNKNRESSSEENFNEIYMNLQTNIINFCDNFKLRWKIIIKDCVENLYARIENSSQCKSIIMSFLNKFLQLYTIFTDKIKEKTIFTPEQQKISLINIDIIVNEIENYNI